MASMNFDFNKIKRSFLNVTLKNGKSIVVKMPLKKTYEKAIAMKNIDEEEMDVSTAIEELAVICSEFLSNNMTKEKVTVKYITENYDLEEMVMFLDYFVAFVSSAKNDPNS